VILVERLSEKLTGSVFHRFEGGLNRAMRRHDDDRDVFGLFQFGQAFQDFETGESKPVGVEEHQVRNFLFNLFHGLHAIARHDGAGVCG